MVRSVRINRILIVGGGSSGWMSAAMLHQLRDVEITLVEASDIPIIGVGESTNSITRRFHTQLGLDEKAFMRAANAAFKIGIRFANFNRNGGAFFHPFGLPSGMRAPSLGPAGSPQRPGAPASTRAVATPRPSLGPMDDRPMRDFFFRRNAQHQYLAAHIANLRNQFMIEGASNRVLLHAYQLDAGLYGDHLKRLYRAKGVRHVVGKITDVERGASGEIAAVHVDGSSPLTADLYVDCSGFRSLLLGTALGEPFRSINHLLLNDKAIAARVPYVDKSDELVTYTNCTALSAGWVWEIPLWSRLGTGYVYSSAFLSRSDAEAEFREFWGANRLRDVELAHIDIRAGRHERAWVGNCVGLGPSYGFIEPLESTGLALTQVAVLDLATALRGGAATAVERQVFNRRQGDLFDNTRDFVLAHYALTEREDTEYWRHIRYALPIPDSLAEILMRARAKTYGSLTDFRDPSLFYRALNWNAILSGMGFFDQESELEVGIDLPRTDVHADLLKRLVYDGEYDEPAVQAPGEIIDMHPTW
jgi:tryptophan 6-halogenase